jgi:hypothetical protein
MWHHIAVVIGPHWRHEINLEIDITEMLKVQRSDEGLFISQSVGLWKVCCSFYDIEDSNIRLSFRFY